jgi:hypothetical protein
VALAYLVATLGSVVVWTGTEREGFLRLLGALVVLTVLLFALQPLLQRARRERVERPLRLVEDDGRAFEVVVQAESDADAVAQAIRQIEREGRHVHSVEVLERTDASPNGRGAA